MVYSNRTLTLGSNETHNIVTLDDVMVVRAKEQTPGEQSGAVGYYKGTTTFLSDGDIVEFLLRPREMPSCTYINHSERPEMTEVRKELKVEVSSFELRIPMGLGDYMYVRPHGHCAYECNDAPYIPYKMHDACILRWMFNDDYMTIEHDLPTVEELNTFPYSTELHHKGALLADFPRVYVHGQLKLIEFKGGITIVINKMTNDAYIAMDNEYFKVPYVKLLQFMYTVDEQATGVDAFCTKDNKVKYEDIECNAQRFFDINKNFCLKPTWSDHDALRYIQTM